MGGLVIDVVIAYFIRAILRLTRVLRSSGWRMESAKIVSARVGGGWVWNCPTAEIAYIYRFEGEPYTGTDITPFLSESSAQDKAERFKRGETAQVRVNPADPERSVLIS